MKVLVTGNLGYIGPVVTAALKAAGHYVVGLDTGWFLPNLAALPEWPHEQVFGDIREDVMIDVDAVVHLAGLSNDPMGALDENLTRAINEHGTMGLIVSAREARHVIVSSCSVYGTAGVATEETPVAPLTAYARAKARVDAMAHSEANGLNAVSLRLGTVYGWSPGHRLDLVVNRMVYDATHGRPITVKGDAARPLVHVEDVARAIVFTLSRPKMRGVYNVVGENQRVNDIGKLVRSHVPHSEIEAVDSDGDQRDYMADASQIEALGWLPLHSVWSTLPDLIEQSTRLGSPSRYVRLNALKSLIASGALAPDLTPKESIAA